MAKRPKIKSKGTSPYRRYGKTPYRYSDTFQNWRAATLKGNNEAAAFYAEEHSKKFGPLSWAAADRMARAA